MLHLLVRICDTSYFFCTPVLRSSQAGQVVLAFFLDYTPIPVRFRCARAGKNVASRSHVRSCLCEVLFTGCRGSWKNKRLKLLTYPSAGWPGAKTVRMHVPTSLVAATDLKTARPQGKRCRKVQMNMGM